MVKEVLVEAAIDAGAKLLSELDRTEFPVDSMFWVQMPEVGHWRLVIGSPLVPEKGSLVVYERLGALLREADLGLSLMNISVFAPDSTQLSSLLSTVEASGLVVSGPSWLSFGEGVIFRWTSDAIRGTVTCELTQAELSRIWEQERKLTNLPKLLFTVQGPQVTIRFHPQHGPLKGLEQTKQPFQSALHRSRPDCQIQWL